MPQPGVGGGEGAQGLRPDGRIGFEPYITPSTDRLVQLADMCAGAIARSFKPDRDSYDRWPGKSAVQAETSRRFEDIAAERLPTVRSTGKAGIASRTRRDRQGRKRGALVD
jgi:hypothetical protein